MPWIPIIGPGVFGKGLGQYLQCFVQILLPLLLPSQAVRSHIPECVSDIEWALRKISLPSHPTVSLLGEQVSLLRTG
jgi:hypothetical protein